MKLYSGSTLITTVQRAMCNMYLCRFSTGDVFHVNLREEKYKRMEVVTVYFIYRPSSPCKREGMKEITEPSLISWYRI